MRRTRLPAPGIFLALVCSLPATGFAQADIKRVEVGGLISVLRLGSFYDVTDFGIGGRGAYNVTPELALESEIILFPSDVDDPFVVMHGGRKIQAFFGPKVGTRSRRIGIFAKARPGFIHFSEGKWRPNSACAAIFPPPEGCFVGETRFLVDLGGVLELYSAR